MRSGGGAREVGGGSGRGGGSSAAAPESAAAAVEAAASTGRDGDVTEEKAHDLSEEPEEKEEQEGEAKEQALADGEEKTWELSMPTSLEDLGEQWASMPSRYRIIIGTCCAFILCNMDKVWSAE
jgi:hypothetical protein